MLERGIVSMKGKGEQQTYWLVGEDAEMRTKRSKEREARRNGKPYKNGLDCNGHCIVPRSSLKSRSSVKSPIARCSSDESPKKLRFASGERLETVEDKSRLLEVITDSSPPCKKSANSLTNTETTPDCCSEGFKTSSTSCPCIENLANSTATLAQSQLSMFCKEEKVPKITKPTSYPSLCSNLAIPCLPVKPISAPSSPRKQEPILAKFADVDDAIPWADSTPLLKITNPEEVETHV